MEEAAKALSTIWSQRLGDRVFRHLIEAIDTSRLPQGAKIQEDVLTAQTGVSKTPIGEALRRLETEGLLIARHIQQVRDDLLKQFA